MVETTAVERPCHSLHTPQPLTYLPFDVIVEILCRLPVKLLLQLCCVCKSWNSLISKDLKFARKHLRMSTKYRYLITNRRIHSKELTIMSYPLDNSIPFHSIVTSNGTQLDYPSIIIRYQRHGLVDSCDGLLCFQINDNLVHIYNPCIRKVKKLPYLDFPHVTCCKYAFGYDPFIDNYKVIAVFSYYVQSHVFKSGVKVYTLGTDSWRRIKDFPSKAPHGRRGIFASGTVNWLTYHISNGFYDFKSPAIVSLHLGNESYQEIPLPDYNVNFNNLTLDVNVMRDCLCIFSQESIDSFIDVWLMKEYGNKDSWVKLIRLPHIGDSGYFPHIDDSGYFFTKILYISEDNNHVLLVFEELDKLKWVVYDCKSDTVVSSKIEDLSWVESNVYVESLISPKLYH